MKSPFDVAREITTKQSNWDENIEKAWNTYMVNRALSMNIDFIEIIDYIQRYYNIPKEVIYKLYCDLIPKNYTYPKYIKSERTTTKDLKAIEVYYQIGKREARDYLNILSEEKLQEIRRNSPDELFTTEKIKSDAPGKSKRKTNNSGKKVSRSRRTA